MADTATEARANEETQRELTFGEKAVGLQFNPSGDKKVQSIKEHMAAVLDIVHEGNGTASSEALGYDLDKLAVGQVVLAQMAAVKAITFQK